MAVRAKLLSEFTSNIKVLLPFMCKGATETKLYSMKQLEIDYI